MFSFADPTLGISWRMADNGDFRETGFIDTLDPRTRKRMPNPSIELPPDAWPARSRSAMSTQSGDMQGPFPIRFDPEAALIRDQRKILDMTATSWLSFREFNGLLVYYTHLVSYRCAIREVRIGIDTSVPNQVLKMPGCDMRDPSAISAGMPLYMKLAAGDAVHSVELTYRDGSVSEIKSFRTVNRATIDHAGRSASSASRELRRFRMKRYGLDGLDQGRRQRKERPHRDRDDDVAQQELLLLLERIAVLVDPARTPARPSACGSGFRGLRGGDHDHDEEHVDQDPRRRAL